MKFLQTVIGIVVYGMLWAVNALYGLVPKNRAYGFGASLARAIYPLFRKREKRAAGSGIRGGHGSFQQDQQGTAVGRDQVGGIGSGGKPGDAAEVLQRKEKPRGQGKGIFGQEPGPSR